MSEHVIEQAGNLQACQSPGNQRHRGMTANNELSETVPGHPIRVSTGGELPLASDNDRYHALDKALVPPDLNDIQQAYVFLCEQEELNLRSMNSPVMVPLSGAEKVTLVSTIELPTRSFKWLAAVNEFRNLSPKELRQGIITASSGNHGLAVASMAEKRGVSCTVVVPIGTPDVKLKTIRGHGAILIRYGLTYDDARSHALKLMEKNGATFLDVSSRHAVAAYGALAMEIINQVPNADLLFVPCGGGALVAGVALGAKALRPDIQIIAVEPEGAACCSESVKAGKLITLENCESIADGAKVKTPDPHLFPILQSSLVDEILTISEWTIKWGMGFLREIYGKRVEGAAVLGAMALLRAQSDLSTPLCGAKGKNIFIWKKEVAALLTGGNTG
jgi:threonine dehydratase